jgi:hypothetical protein
MKLSAHGIETDLQPGWEGRISLRAAPSPGSRTLGDPGEVNHPIAHLANFPLPQDRGDYGSGAVDVMGEDHVLVVLFEFGPECVDTPLFARRGMPRRLTPSMFSAAALQRTLPGQAGCQIFFTEAGRAFCCYTVLGRQANAARVLPHADATLNATRILPR